MVSVKKFLYRHFWAYRYLADNRSDAIQFGEVYDNAPCEEDISNRCVVMFSGKSKLWGVDYHGGLADRLKGMVSVYKVCKDLGKEYRILHTLPFPLEKYLVPNLVDWRIGENEIVYNVNAVSPHWLRHSPFSNDEEKYYYWRLKKLLKGRRTHHVYSNAQMVSQEEFRELFLELFKPSAALQSAIDKNKMSLSRGWGGYISLSYRFTHLLGDEIDSYLEELDEVRKTELLQKGLESIKTIHCQCPTKKLLVNSDSARFLEAVRKEEFDYVYITQGTPVHIDQQFNASDEDYMKTFVDFYLIAGAEKVFLVKLEGMRNSGFPKVAAMTGGKSFEILTF